MRSILIDICKRFPIAITQQKAQEIYLSLPQEYQNVVKLEHFAEFMSGNHRGSFLWHDYEAGGTDARADPPMQCAMIRTDLNMNIIDIPIDIYCKLHGDKLPHPMAIKITKISPLKCVNEGIDEPAFFRIIAEQMTFPDTCNTGYNSMSYDDEMTRFGLWRNLINVYSREWQNGCSRWDLYPVTAAYAAFKTDNLYIPRNEDGTLSLKLESLAKSNSIIQESAHNAIDDVKALIGLAKVLKTANPILWESLFSMRLKKNNTPLLLRGKMGWIVHKKIGQDTLFKAPVILLGSAAGQDQKIIYARLDKLNSLRECYHDSIEAIKEKLYMKDEALKNLGIERPGIGTIQANKQPQFIPSENSLLPEMWVISEEEVTAGKNLMNAKSFLVKISHALSYDDLPENDDPELALYSAGFPSHNDKMNLSLIQNTALNQIEKTPVNFSDERYNVLQKRITMKIADNKEWWHYCKDTLTRPVDQESKHSKVNWDTVLEALNDAALPNDLKNEYMAFLAYLSDKTGLTLVI